MRTRKILAVIISAIMILSMIPAAMIIASAESDGTNMWTTNRQANEYEEEMSRPEAGFSYTNKGFVTKGADFTNTNPFLNIETKEPVNVKDGLFMEVVVTNFSYRGLSGTEDEWISFNVWSEATLYPGQVGYGQGYLNLLRSAGKGGNAQVENYLTSDTQFSTPTGGPNVTPKTNLQNQEVWTFEVRYSETEGYTFLVNGTVVLTNNADYNELLEGLSADGMFYVGVSFHSTENGGAAEAMITKYGNSSSDYEVPAGDETKEPEENVWDRDWECEDEATVPANTPALLWDASKSCFSKDPKGTNLTFEAIGRDAYHVTASGSISYFSWAISPDYCYDGYDFDTLAIFARNLNCNMGNVYICAGDVVAANDGNKAVFVQYDKTTTFYLDEEENEYALMILDLEDKWSGRIHQLRVGFDQLDMSMPEFDIMYMGLFRSPEEAKAYTDDRYSDLTIDGEGSDETESESESESETVTETESETVTESETETATETATNAATETSTEAETAKSGGCGAVIGASAAAVVLAAAAAAVALKKKD